MLLKYIDIIFYHQSSSKCIWIACSTIPSTGFALPCLWLILSPCHPHVGTGFQRVNKPISFIWCLGNFSYNNPKTFCFCFFVFLSMTLPSHSSSRLFALGVVTFTFTCLSPLDPHLVIVLDWKLWLVFGIHMTYKSFRLGAWALPIFIRLATYFFLLGHKSKKIL